MLSAAGLHWRLIRRRSERVFALSCYVSLRSHPTGSDPDRHPDSERLVFDL